MTHIKAGLLGAGLLGAGLALGLSAPAAAASLEPAAATALGTLAPAASFAKASYSTGGVGLRNRGAGGIIISGVTTPVKAAYLYWAVITNGAPLAAHKQMIIQRNDSSAPSAVTVTGSVVGTGPTPCWYFGSASNFSITVYRASISTAVASGNGAYTITLLPGASGDTSGADPLALGASQDYPLMEGASLVVIGTGSATVAVYDKGLAGATFRASSGLSYTLSLPGATPGGQTIFDAIGADGQTVTAGASGHQTESVTITTSKSLVISGPGSPVIETDWSGRAGGIRPQLWDNSRHFITSAVPANTKSIGVAIVGSSDNDDCQAPVANVVSTQ